MTPQAAPLLSDARGRRPGLYPTAAFRGGRPVGRPPDRCVCVCVCVHRVRRGPQIPQIEPTDRDRTVPIRQLFVSPELGFFSRSVGSPGGTGEGWVGGPPGGGGGTHGPLWVQPKAGVFFAEKCLISPLFDPYSWVPRDPPRGSSDPPWGGGSIGRTPSPPGFKTPNWVPHPTGEACPTV